MTDWPPPPHGITVRGGGGRSYADLDELRHAANALRRAADVLEEAAEHVGSAARAVRLSAAQSPATARAAEDCLAPLLPTGASSLAALAGSTRELAHRLHCAAELYGAAENRVGAIWRAMLSALGNSAGTSPLAALTWGLVLGNVALRVGVLALGVRLLRGQPIPSPGEVAVALPLEEVLAGVAGLLRGLAPGPQLAVPNPIPETAGGVVVGVGLAATALLALRRDPLLVTPRLGATTLGPAPATAADVLADVRDLYPAAGGTAGTVGIERIVRPDGSPSWVVAIPGMQSGGLGWGTNPMDMDTNLRLMAPLADDGTRLVLRALAQAGVPATEPILLAGHSQGGMVAMALAASPAFRARYTVAAVLTAGSPTGTQPAPEGVPTLHLEHSQDLVTQLDASPSAAGRHRTIVERDLRVSTDPRDRFAARDPGAAHGIDAYVRTAGAASAVGAASVQEWESAAARVLGDPSDPAARAVRREFTGTRLERAAAAASVRTTGADGASGSRP